jgi:tetratricopeptide (TPR) repeat protein
LRCYPGITEICDISPNIILYLNLVFLVTKQKGMPKSDSLAKKSQKSTSSTFNIAKWYPVILIIISILVYNRSIHYQFVGMDEDELILQKADFNKHVKNIPKAFTQSVFEGGGQEIGKKLYYRPILVVSLILDTQFHSKAIATPYHTANLLYHIIACLLLYFLLKKLSLNASLSFILTLLFAVQPLNEYAVAWIMGRNDILLAIFVLLSFHGLLDYYKSKDTKYLVLHLFSFAMAVFTKESGVLLLPLFFLFMLLWFKDIQFYWRNKAITVFYVIIAIGWFLARWSVMHGHEGNGSKDSILHIVIQNIPFLLLYIGKIFLPFNLNVMPGVNEMALILGFLSFLILVSLFYFIKDRKKALFSLIWFFLFLSPTLLVPSLPAYEHRDYVPFIGLILGISQVSFFKDFRFEFQRKSYIVIGLVILFIIITSIRLPIYENEFTFNEDGTENTPFAADACINLADLYIQQYNNTKSRPALELSRDWSNRGLALDSTILQGNNLYGAYFYYSGQPEEAIKYFQKEIKWHPDNMNPYSNLAAHYRHRDPAKAVYYWKQMINADRYFLNSYWELSKFYNETGDSITGQKYYDQGMQMSEEIKRKEK